MTSNATHRPLVPLALGLTVLTVLLVAALIPNTGAVPAQSNCQYNVCTSTGTSATTWEVVIGLLFAIAAVLAFVILRGRRRESAAGGPPDAWEGPTGGSGGPAAPAADYAEAGLVGGGAAAGGAAAYMEGPEDVGAPPPVPRGAPPPAAGAGEADIDSLMAELDKISGEILQRGTPPKKPGAVDETDKTS